MLNFAPPLTTEFLSMKQGKVYLIPSPIGSATPTLCIEELEQVRYLRHFAVEEERTARRFLSQLDMPTPITELQLITLNKNSDNETVNTCISWLKKGISVGVISEAGMPGVADPGAKLAASAHENGIEVVPLVGASSILLTIAASGLNGQNFAFVGYLPVKNEERRARILQLEARSRTEQQTQLFIETPYRNDKMCADLLATLAANTYLCIANGLHCEGGFLRTLRVAQWRQLKVKLGKLPTLFALLAENYKERKKQ